MVDTLFFVNASGQDPTEIAAAYQLHGWNIEVSAPTAVDALDRMAASSPAAAVFCLDGGCAPDVTAFAALALSDARTNHPLMVFVDGTPDDIATARGVAQYGIFVRPDELSWVLKRLTAKL